MAQTDGQKALKVFIESVEDSEFGPFEGWEPGDVFINGHRIGAAEARSKVITDVKPALKDVNQMITDLNEMEGVNKYVLASVHKKVINVLDLLEKEGE